MASPDIFKTKVVPIMNKVRDDLNSKCADEMEAKQSSMAYLAAGAAGPDGGMAAMSVQTDTLRYTGKWNSKTVEDYISMVKKELKKSGVKVTKDIEKKMIDKMINEQVPKSSAEYIMKKAASCSLFYIPQAVTTSPMQAQINKEAERRYNPSALEKGAGWALGSAADYLTTAGLGGSWSTAAKFIGVDMAMNAVSEKLDDDVPLVIAPEHRADYKANQKKTTQQPAKAKTEEKSVETPKSNIAEAEDIPAATYQPSSATPVDNQAEVSQGIAENQNTGDYSGWNGLLDSMGLAGIGDTTNHLGFTLAMLPDMLLGAFTGRTKSIGLNKGTMMPLAALISGTFIKNPLLKIPLLLWGGANLVNKVGQEALAEQRQEHPSQQLRYKQYADETLNERIKNPHIEGNVLIVDIDNTPRIVTLPDTLADAYQQGAIPLNTLANRILAKTDQMAVTQSQQQSASERYEQSQEREQTRGIR